MNVEGDIGMRIGFNYLRIEYGIVLLMKR